MSAAEATREVYWNISHVWVMYALLVPTVGVGLYGFYRRIRLWRLGQPAVRFDRWKERLALFFKHALGQRRTISHTYAGLFHVMIYTGFIMLTAATTVVFVDQDLRLPIMRGQFYLIFQSLIVDFFGLFVMIGVGLAAGRRWLRKPRQLVYTDEASLILVAIFVLALTGFLVEGWRIAATQDPWRAWSPVGSVFAAASESVMRVDQMKAAHRVAWWFHMGLAFGFLAWAPYTKLAHVVTAPLNIFTANLDGYGGSLKTIDFETAESLGVNSLTDFTWKDLLDLDACTECGRCTAVCPANAVGKKLSPRDLILDLRDLMHREAGTLRGVVFAGGEGEGSQKSNGSAKVRIIHPETAVSPEALWSCTSCAACMEACPVYIEQLPKIVDARRFLVMEKAEFPDTMQEAITSLETRGHPYKGTQFNRVDWAEGLDLPIMSEMSEPHEAEVLFWVGCGGALIERNQSTVQATAQLLKKAGIKFAILGREESCTGDPARRIGNEFLFEMLAKANVKTLEKYGVKKIVTSCPHCFNTFANEYPEFGGRYEVYHHSQFLNRLVADGKLVPRRQRDSKVTFHDPCYLGRYNGEYEAPRDVVQLTSRRQMEMAKSRASSFCCGGGGGMSFVDEDPDHRVNQERAQQALDTGADVVAVACPFCTTMLEDGVNARKGERDVKVMDVAELLWESVQDESVGATLDERAAR